MSEVQEEKKQDEAVKKLDYEGFEFDPIPGYLQTYQGDPEKEPTRTELAMMFEAHRIYGPSMVDAFGGDWTKIAPAVSMMAYAMGFVPGQWPALPTKPEKTKVTVVEGGKK